MLSPEKEREAFTAAEDSAAPSTLASFSAILSSVEGVRQFTQEVALDEIIRTQEQVLQMIERLSSLQHALTSFAAIKQSIARLQEQSSRESPENKTAPNRESSREFSHGSNTPPEKLISFPGVAKFGEENPNQPTQEAPAETVSPLTNSPPAVQNLSSEADRSPMTGGTEDLPATQFPDFTLGEDMLPEEKFELGSAPAGTGAGAKESNLDRGHHAAISSTPEETAPVTFSLDEDQKPTELPAILNATGETVPSDFFDRMIDTFMEFVGPMAAVIVEEQVANLGESFAAFPRSRLDDLIELAGRELPDDQSQVRFQKQMAEKVRTLTSQAAPASPRKKND